MDAQSPTIAKLYYNLITDTALRRVNLDGTAGEILYRTPGGSRVDVAVDYLDGKLYFPSNTAGGILRSTLDGTGVELAVAVEDGIDTLAVDSVRRQIYWSDSSPERVAPGGINAIWRANFDGGDRELLFDGLPRVTAIEVDADSGQFFWADFYTGQIRRTAIDTLDTEIILDAQTFGSVPYPAGLTIDLAKQRMYVADKALEAIVRVGLDGSNPEILITGVVADPSSIAIDPIGERIYWANWAGNEDTLGLVHHAVMSATLDGRDIRREFIAKDEWGVRSLVTNLAVVQMVVPEPNSMAALGAGLLVLYMTQRGGKATKRACLA